RGSRGGRAMRIGDTPSGCCHDGDPRCRRALLGRASARFVACSRVPVRIPMEGADRAEVEHDLAIVRQAADYSTALAGAASIKRAPPLWLVNGCGVGFSGSGHESDAK